MTIKPFDEIKDDQADDLLLSIVKTMTQFSDPFVTLTDEDGHVIFRARVDHIDPQ